MKNIEYIYEFTTMDEDIRNQLLVALIRSQQPETANDSETECEETA